VSPGKRVWTWTAVPPGVVSRGSRMFGAHVVQSTDSSAFALASARICVSSPMTTSVGEGLFACTAWMTFAMTSVTGGPGVKVTFTFKE